LDRLLRTIFNTLRGSLAQIANQNTFLFWQHGRGPKGAGTDTFSTADAILFIHSDRTGFPVFVQCLKLTGLNARGIHTLMADDPVVHERIMVPYDLDA